MAALLIGFLACVDGVYSESPLDAVEICLPLDENGAYEVERLWEQSNQLLGTNYSVEQQRGQKRLLSPTDRTALLLADKLGFADVELTNHRLTIRFHPTSDELQRQETRRRLIRWLDLPTDYWTPNHGLRIPTDFAPGRPTLLVVHGLGSAGMDLEPFERACTATRIQLLKFDYPNDGPLADAGKRLNQELSKLLRSHPNLRIAVVGHSMGGLVARYCLEAPEMSSCGVSHLFMLGTPHRGSALAREYGLYELLVRALPRGMAGLRAALGDGLGEAVDDLEPGSRFLETLNALPRPAHVRYHVGIGTRGFLQAEQRDRLVAEVTRILATRGVPRKTQQELLALLHAEELTSGMADGAVTIQSARLKGVDDERFFVLNHIELLSLPGGRPEESEVFQWILAEMGWQKNPELSAVHNE